MTQIERAHRLIDVYFEPWGAGKAAEWEDLTNDKPFNLQVLIVCLSAALVAAEEAAQVSQ